MVSRILIWFKFLQAPRFGSDCRQKRVCGQQETDCPQGHEIHLTHSRLTTLSLFQLEF